VQTSRNHMRRARIVIASVGVVVTAAACGSDGDSGGSGGSGGSGDTYTVGAVIPLSGTNQVYGDNYRVALDLCATYANENLGLDGKIEMEYADGEGLPAPSVTAMNQVVNVKDAIAVITGFSAPTKALAPIANQLKVPLFNGGASSPDLQGLGDYIFNNIPLADQQIPASTSYVIEDLGDKTWFVIYSNETLGLSMLDALENAVPEHGGEIIGKAEVSSQATDFGAQVAAIRDAKPDAVFLATTSGASVPTIIRQIRDIPETLAEPGADGMLFSSQSIDYDIDNELTKYFVEQFEKQYPDDRPTTLQANYCSEMSIIGTAIKALEKSGDEVSGENLMKEIHDIGTFDVVGGEVTFADDGTVDLPIDVRVVEDGALKVAYTYTPED
jgi:branched-chain amino acid transport system substrate-binding protein